MNLTQILAQLVALANRRDFTANTALQNTFVAQAIMRIQKELRCPAMEKNVAVTIALAPAWAIGTTYAIGAVVSYNGNNYTSLQSSNTGNEPDTSNTFWSAGGFTGLVIPSDFLELIYIMPTNTYLKCTKSDITKVRNGARASGDPETYCRDGGVWFLSPMPNVGDVINLSYYAELTPLVNGTDSNTISDIAWDLIVYAALVQFAIFFKDSRKDDFEGQYQMLLEQLQDQSDDDDLNSAAVVEPCYNIPLDWTFEHY